MHNLTISLAAQSTHYHMKLKELTKQKTSETEKGKFMESKYPAIYVFTPNFLCMGNFSLNVNLNNFTCDLQINKQKEGKGKGEGEELRSSRGRK